MTKPDTSVDAVRTWAQGYFVHSTQTGRWTKEEVAEANEEEKHKVRPSATGNAICWCPNPDDAAWIGSRLNLAVTASSERDALRAEVDAQAAEIEWLRNESPDDIDIYRAIKVSGARKHGEIAKVIATLLSHSMGQGK